MEKARFFVSTLVVAILAGCGEPEVSPEDAYNPTELQGTVDASLPPELQAKQAAVQQVLGLVLQGVAIEMLPGYVDSIQFNETAESFFQSAYSLVRWDFDGTPTDNNVPVVLYLSLDGNEENIRQIKRVYTVTERRGRFTIAPK